MDLPVFVPSYYSLFKCIAGKCQHTCCAGWEIDVDDKSYKAYMNMSGSLGEKLRQNIITNEDGTHSIRLMSEDRCPFLNSSNLCEIILEKGESAICNICTDHPRYRNYEDDYILMGLGLCCEEAVRLILTYDKKVEYYSLDGPEILEFESVFQDRNLDIVSRMREVSPKFNSFSDCLALLKEMEVLSPDWTDILNKCHEISDDEINTYLNSPDKALMFEQLLVYFEMRYIDDPDVSVEASRIIAGINLCINENDDFNCFCEIVRMFSSEVEYSDINIERFKDFVWID